MVSIFSVTISFAPRNFELAISFARDVFPTPDGPNNALNPGFCMEKERLLMTAILLPGYVKFRLLHSRRMYDSKILSYENQSTLTDLFLKNQYPDPLIMIYRSVL